MGCGPLVARRVAEVRRRALGETGLLPGTDRIVEFDVCRGATNQLLALVSGLALARDVGATAVRMPLLRRGYSHPRDCAAWRRVRGGRRTRATGAAARRRRCGARCGRRPASSFSTRGGSPRPAASRPTVGAWARPPADRASTLPAPAAGKRLPRPRRSSQRSANATGSTRACRAARALDDAPEDAAGRRTLRFDCLLDTFDADDGPRADLRRALLGALRPSRDVIGPVVDRLAAALVRRAHATTRPAPTSFPGSAGPASPRTAAARVVVLHLQVDADMREHCARHRRAGRAEWAGCGRTAQDAAARLEALGVPRDAVVYVASGSVWRRDADGEAPPREIRKFVRDGGGPTARRARRSFRWPRCCASSRAP